MPRLLDFKMDCFLPVADSKNAGERSHHIDQEDITRDQAPRKPRSLTLEISDNDWSELLLTTSFP